MDSDKAQISLEGGKTKSPLYLAGSSYDTYDGQSWKQSNTEKTYEGEEEYLLQYEELMSALSQSI